MNWEEKAELTLGWGLKKTGQLSTSKILLNRNQEQWQRLRIIQTLRVALLQLTRSRKKRMIPTMHQDKQSHFQLSLGGKSSNFCEYLLRTALVCWGHPNRAADTEICFLTIIEAGGLTSRWRAVSLSSEASPFSQCLATFSLCLQMAFPPCVSIPISSYKDVITLD